jgi:hypothetical protein
VTIATDVTGKDDAPITSVRVRAEVTFTFRHEYDLTDPLWAGLLAEGTARFMGRLEKQIEADIRADISSQLSLSDVMMNFHRSHG